MAASGHAEPDEDVTLASIPIRRPGHAALGALLMVVASLWLAAAIRGSLTGSPAIIAGLGSFGAYLAAAVGVALAVLAAHWMLRPQTVVLKRGANSIQLCFDQGRWWVVSTIWDNERDGLRFDLW